MGEAGAYSSYGGMIRMCLCRLFNYIDMVDDISESWRFTGLCGEPKWEERHLRWDELRLFNSRLRLPWLVRETIMRYSTQMINNLGVLGMKWQCKRHGLFGGSIVN